MKEQILVTIGREHGSGGHYIAQLLAEQLQIQLYDKEIVERIIESSGYSREMVSAMDEKPINFFFSRRIGEYSNSLEAIVAEKTFALIRSRAEAGESFVVVGRCAEQVLAGNPNLIRLFICGEKEEKCSRIMRTDNVSAEQAENIRRDVDRKRKSYHNYYCDFKWGDSRGYDLTVNSSKLGIRGTADFLAYYLRAFMAQE